MEKSDSTIATYPAPKTAEQLAWKMDAFFAEHPECQDFAYSIQGLSAGLRAIGVAE